MKAWGFFIGMLALCGCAGGGVAPALIEPNSSGRFETETRPGLGIATLVIDDTDNVVGEVLAGFQGSGDEIGERSLAEFRASGFRILAVSPDELGDAIRDLPRRSADGVRWIDPTGQWTLLVRGRAADDANLGLAARAWLGPNAQGVGGLRVEIRPVRVPVGRIDGGYQPIAGPTADWWLAGGSSLLIAPAGPSEKFEVQGEDQEAQPRRNEGTLGEQMLAGHAGDELVARVLIVLQASAPSDFLIQNPKTQQEGLSARTDDLRRGR